MLKCANVALEILLEFGMLYPYQSLTIDKCHLLVRCWIIFLWFQIIKYEFSFIFFVWLYIIYNILFVVHNLLYIVNYTLYTIHYIINCTIYTIYHSISPWSAKNNYFALDSIKKIDYRRFVLKITRITLVKCLKFGKFLIIY